MRRMILKIILAVSLILIAINSPTFAATYYAAPAGGGSICTIDNPCTLNTGINKLGAGDTLYLRGGTYNQTVSVSTNGRSGLPITIQSYSGETATIDGGNTLPSGGCYSFLVNISGDYVTLKNLSVINSYGGLINVSGDHDELNKITGNGSGETGIVAQGDSDIIDGSSMTDNGNRYGNGCSTWGSAICTTGTNTMIQNCVSHDNQGEGLNAYRGASHVTIQDNISYNNHSVNLYIDSASYVTARRNLVYNTSDGPSSSGIVLGHETSDTTTNNTVVNNLVYGCYLNFMTDSNLTALTNATIAYNTFLDSRKTQAQIDNGYNMGVYFRPQTTSFTGSIFKNNIVYEDDSRLVPISVASGMDFSHNLWSSTPDSDAAGTGDVIGDPLLLRTGSTGAGELSANYFKVSSSSPAIGAGVAISGISTDYFGTARSDPSTIGAYEYVSSGGSAVTINPPTNLKVVNN